MTDDGGSKQGGSNEGDEKLDSGCILKMERKGLPDRLTACGT